MIEDILIKVLFASLVLCMFSVCYTACWKKFVTYGKETLYFRMAKMQLIIFSITAITIPVSFILLVAIF